MEWKSIEGFEGLYEVNDLGEIRSLKYGPMKQIKNYTGYMRIGLRKNGIKKMLLVHRIVAEAFIPNPNNLPQINHINEDKTDNRVENLEWCDSKYNINYGNRKQKVREKELNGKRSKKVNQYLNGELINTYPSLNEAARQTGIKLTNISSCCNKKEHYNTAGGYYWEFA